MNNQDQMPHGGQLQSNVDIKSLPDVICEKCQNTVFISGYMIKKVSPILSSTGKAGYMPIPTFACSKCGHVNIELNPLKQNSNEANPSDGIILGKYG